LAQSIQRKKLHQNWMKNKNSINLPNFRIWAHLRPLFEINVYYGPSKTHLDDHLKKTTALNWIIFFLKF
jgi:hypothetical protein